MIVTPLIEEFAFRGVIYSGLRKKYGIVISLLLQASIYALIHIRYIDVMELQKILILFILGIAWGYVYERTRNIFYCVVMHGLFNVLIYYDMFLRQLLR